jgi:hypothetical protein
MLVLDNPESTPADREAVSREVHAIVTGMGGLLDLSLIPNSNSSLSEMSAADRRDRLADALYTATA